MKKQRKGRRALYNICNLFMSRIDQILDQDRLFTLDKMMQVIPEGGSKRRFYDVVNVWEGLGVVKCKMLTPRQYKWVGPAKAHKKLVELCKHGFLKFNVPPLGFKGLIQTAFHMGLYCCTLGHITTLELKKAFNTNRRVYDVVNVMKATRFMSEKKDKTYKNTFYWSPCDEENRKEPIGVFE